MRYGLLALVLISVTALGGCSEGVLDPKGPIATAERQILFNSLGIMLAIVIPTIFATLGVAFWFRSSNPRAVYLPDFTYSGRLELLVWSIPAMTVLLVGGVAWVGAHDLDPRKAISATVKPVISPSGLARLEMAVHLSRARHRQRQSSDRASRHANQFRADFLERHEQLLRAAAGQPDLHHVGNGDAPSAAGRPCWNAIPGFRPISAATALPTCALPSMRCRPSSLRKWVTATRNSGPVLDAATYADLAKPSHAVAPFTYRSVAPGLFNNIVNSGMSPDDPICLTYSTSQRAETMSLLGKLSWSAIPFDQPIIMGCVGRNDPGGRVDSFVDHTEGILALSVAGVAHIGRS